MTKSHDKKGILIGALLFAIVTMSVGYAALSQRLTVVGTASVADARWDVKITSITLDAANSVGVTESAEPTLEDDGGVYSASNATTAIFGVNLSYPGAKAVYKVVVTNNGNIDALLKDITDLTSTNSEEPTDIKFTISGVTANDKLAASATHTYTVTAEWLASGVVIPEITSKIATIVLNYEQD